jgi:trans-aconitate 2-methyltransferase
MDDRSVGHAAGGSEPSAPASQAAPTVPEPASGARIGQSTSWEPEHYLRFADQRTRPVTDLIAQIRVRAPRFVTDLGCGPGNATELFSDRWPDALVLGVDSSAEMIEAASRRARPGRLEFSCADLREWRAAEPPDAVVSNAALQWVPGHLSLLPRLVDLVAPGGCFAFTVPGNFAQPSHTLLAELQHGARWSGRFSGEHFRPKSHEPAEYLRALTDTGAEAEVWETTYHHVLDGKSGAFDYAYSTILRPVLAELGGADTEDAHAFLADYAAALLEAYPPTELSGRTVQVMPYRRLFAVAYVPEG